MEGILVQPRFYGSSLSNTPKLLCEPAYEYETTICSPARQSVVPVSFGPAFSITCICTSTIPPTISSRLICTIGRTFIIVCNDGITSGGGSGGQSIRNQVWYFVSDSLSRSLFSGSIITYADMFYHLDVLMKFGSNRTSGLCCSFSNFLVSWFWY